VFALMITGAAVMDIACVIGAPRCANVMWIDLAFILWASAPKHSWPITIAANIEEKGRYYLLAQKG
jgi:hypothetical protein